MSGLFGMAPAWYGVTNAPVNLAAQWSLGNHGYTTNWGGETQFNMFPSYMSESQMAGTKSLMGQYTMPVFGGYPGNLGMLAASCTPQEQQVLGNSYAEGVKRGQKIVMDLDVKNVQGVITELKSLLVKNAKDKNMNASQRDRLIEVAKQVEDAEHRLETANYLRKQGASDTAVNEELKAIKQLITELQQDSTVLSKELQEELQSTLAKKGIDTKDFSTIDGVKTQEEVKKSETEKPSKEEETAKTAANKVDAMKRKEAKALCDKFFNAIDGAGTDFDKYEDVINSLDSDNIVEVMSQWQLTYGKEYNESFIESFLNDSGHYQKRNFGTKILNALEERAEKAGANVDHQSSVVKSELSSWWILDKKVTENINDMLAQIIVAEHPELQETEEETKKAA